MGRFHMSAEQVAEAIGVPVADWSGKCYSIASAMVGAGLVKGTVVYGHWVGPVHRRSPFHGRVKLVGFTHHGWVLLEDEITVVDPTRWVFEADAPYVFRGEPPLECSDFEPSAASEYECALCGHVDEEHGHGFFRPCTLCAWPYDEGGNKLRERLRTAPPDFGSQPAGDRKPRRIFRHLSAPAETLVSTLFGEAKRGKGGALDWAQCHWLATLPYEAYGKFAGEVYAALKAEGLVALVPIDNRRRAERECTELP